jgi:hypothetical protein
VVVWELAHAYQIVREGGWYFDPVRVIGVYATESDAQEALERARILPGFAETANFEGDNGLTISAYQLDELHWSEGFVRVPS